MPTAQPNALALLSSRGRSATPGPFVYPQSGGSYQSYAGNAAGSAYNQGQGFTNTAGGQYGALFGQGNALASLASPAIQSLLNAYLGELGIGGGAGNATGGVGKAPPGGDNNNPYQLSEYESQQLNSQLDAVNTHYQDLQNQTKQALIARGIDPATEGSAAMAYLSSQQQAASSQVQANYMETLRQNKITQTQNALASVLGLSQLGLNTESGATGGTAGLGGQEFGVQGALGNIVQGDASSNVGASIINDLGGILGAYAGGAFNKNNNGNALLNLLAATQRNNTSGDTSGIDWNAPPGYGGIYGPPAAGTGGPYSNG